MPEEYELDVTNMACPLPIVKLKKFLSEHSEESLIVVLKVTDKGALRDIPAFCRQQQVDCLFEGEEEGVLKFKLAKT